MGKDTHTVSEPAQRTALEVLAANGVETIIQENASVTPTPVISHAILVYNRGRKEHFADGIVITPTHNPPEDGGFKYNPPNGGPADTDITGWVEKRANALLAAGNKEVKRATGNARTLDLGNVIDMEAIKASGLRIGVDPLGGASDDYWARIAEKYGLAMSVVKQQVD